MLFNNKTHKSTPSLTVSLPIMFFSSSLIMPCNLVCAMNFVRLTDDPGRTGPGSAHLPSGQNESLQLYSNYTHRGIVSK